MGQHHQGVRPGPEPAWWRRPYVEPSPLAWWSAHCWAWTREIVMVLVGAVVAPVLRSLRRLARYVLMVIGVIMFSLTGTVLGTLLPWH